MTTAVPATYFNWLIAMWFSFVVTVLDCLSVYSGSFEPPKSGASLGASQLPSTVKLK